MIIWYISNFNEKNMWKLSCNQPQIRVYTSDFPQIHNLRYIADIRLISRIFSWFLYKSFAKGQILVQGERSQKPEKGSPPFSIKIFYRESRKEGLHGLTAVAAATSSGPPGPNQLTNEPWRVGDTTRQAEIEFSTRIPARHIVRICIYAARFR